MAERSIFNVDQFKAAMVGGGARANQFFVQLSFPGYVSGGAFAATQAGFLVNAAALPGSVVNPTIVPYRGREVKFAGERTFAPWTITILNDVSFNIRNSLERWMEGMNGLANNLGRTDPRQYQADLYVTQLDRNNNPLKIYELKAAFPVDLGEIALNFGDNDTIESYTCTFQYQYYQTPASGLLSVGNAAGALGGLAGGLTGGLGGII
jgi:hypothetical protein